MFLIWHCLEKKSTSRLLLDLGIDKEESLKIVQTVRSSKDSSQSWNKKPTVSGKHSSSSIPGSTNAFDLLQQEQSAGSIVTFCEKFDDMLGGGVPVGKITEFCGAPGIGKTQIGYEPDITVMSKLQLSSYGLIMLQYN